MVRQRSHFKIPAHASLIVRSMVSVFLLLLLIIAVASAVTFVDMKQKAEDQLDRESQYISQITTQAIALPLWNFDKPQVIQQLEALKGSQNFCGARITDSTGAVFADVDYPQRLPPHQIMHRSEIAFDNPNDDSATPEPIGSLELCISTIPTQKQLQQTISQQGLFFALISIGVLTACYTSLMFVTRPLLHIRHAMEQVARTMEPISDAALLKQNEIGALANSFNTMVFDLSRTYKELTQAKESAIKADNAKSEFLANMSHELRTPLNNIIGIIQILDTRGLSSEQREMLGMVRKSSQTLLHIVNDILDISKIEAGEMKLEAIAFDIAERIRHTTNTMKPMASRKGFNLDIVMKDSTLPVTGDPVRFERVLTNLLSNAIRYTETGSVTVEAYTRSEGIDPKKIILTVKVIDTGIGIPKEKHDKVFEKFIQADTSDTRRYGGTGLGLTITKELIELMNGKIGLESEVGRGTTFWFEIPLELTSLVTEKDDFVIADTELSEFEGGIPVGEARILVAEDHEMNQIFMQKLFKNIGVVHYTIVNNGREAVDILEAQNFDLILMDCHMPEMNGYDATITIRRLSDSITSEIPIVAMTANAMAKDQERCLAIGMNDYLSKPFEISEFKRKLSRWIQFKPETRDDDRIGMTTDIPANMELLNASSMGDKGYIQTMLELFVSTASEQISIMERNSHDGVSQEWVETAHSLKGTAGVVGATRMLRLAAEAQAMENATATARKEKSGTLRSEYERVLKYLIHEKLYTEPPR